MTTRINELQRMELEIVQAQDGSSMYIDVILPTSMARATIGELGTGRGYCDTEILDADTQELTYWQHHEFVSSTDLTSVLREFFEKLREMLPRTSVPSVAFELPLADRTISLNALLEPLLTAAGQ